MSYDAFLWHIVDREEQSEWEALFVHSVIEWVRRKTGMEYRTILDAPCGNGRLHPFLKTFGYDVRGFDISEELVREAKERGCDCWVGDLRDPKSYRGKYDAVLNWFTSFGYFDHEENIKVMENFYDALKEGGILILDFPVFGRGFADKEFIGIVRRGEEFVEIMESSPEEKVNKLRNRLFRDLGNKLELVKEIKLNLVRYAPEELVSMMKDVGFSEIFTFETMKTAPPNEKSRRITFAAVK